MRPNVYNHERDDEEREVDLHVGEQAATKDASDDDHRDFEAQRRAPASRPQIEIP